MPKRMRHKISTRYDERAAHGVSTVNSDQAQQAHVMTRLPPYLEQRKPPGTMLSIYLFFGRGNIRADIRHNRHNKRNSEGGRKSKFAEERNELDKRRKKK